jgi:glycosyltransferase involved in cell wall biosynthesis
MLDFKRRLPRLPGRNFFHRVDHFKKDPDLILPDIDAFHTSSFDLQKPRKAKYIVGIHDVIVKAYPFVHEPKTIMQIDEQLKRVLGEADVLVADSHNTKLDLMRFYNVSESMIYVVYPGGSVSNMSKAKPWTSYVQGFALDRDYILFVGTLEPRKNVDGLIKAFDWLKKEYGIKHKLYIVGMKGWMFDKIFKAYDEAQFKKDIVFKGYVNDKELESLYQNASLFAYPSFYEGFGFPILEAFSYGLPVVTSSTSSCGEVAGEAALLIEPSDYKEIATAILKLINDKELRETLSRKAIARAKEFTWTRTAEKFLTLFTQGRV